MDEQTICAVVDEIAPLLVGRMFGKIFQLTRASFAVDFRLSASLDLLISAEPNEPRLYLIARSRRELEKSALNPAPFFLTLRKYLGGARLREITKDENERIVRFHFDATDELDAPHRLTLIAQLTGRAANIFLLDAESRIIDVLRSSHTRETAAAETKATGTHQTLHIGDTYQPPSRPANITHQPNQQSKSALRTPRSALEASAIRNHPAPISAALDENYQNIVVERAFDSRVTTLAAQLRQEIARRQKLRRNLENDLLRHGDAETHKHIGDLLLANLRTAERRGNIVRLVDYFADDAPTIEFEVDENLSLQQEAAHRFARYTKAKRAAQEISERLEKINGELQTLETQRAELERIKTARDFDALAKFSVEIQSASGNKRIAKRQLRDEDSTPFSRKRKADEIFKGARRYRSSDGYEILVGRAAKDNDVLTFRVARSSDLWLHAADYPGSHVIIRNPTRKEIPHRTIIEAAQLAAQFSHAKNDTKVAVNYTLRKFVSKPKGSASGLVRLSSFRTLLVEPRESVERML